MLRAALPAAARSIQSGIYDAFFTNVSSADAG
jgi:hypothetical protein